MKCNWLPAVATALLMVSCTSPATRADKNPAGIGTIAGASASPSETEKPGEFRIAELRYNTERSRFAGGPRREVRRLNRFLGIVSGDRRRSDGAGGDPGYQRVPESATAYSNAETYKFEALKYDVEKGVFSGTPQPEVDRLNVLLDMTRSKDGVPVR